MRRTLDQTVNRFTAGLALIGAAGVIAMLIHVTAYVVMRYFTSTPVPATVEIVSHYYMVLIAFLPLAWAERRGEMISIEIFASVMPSAMKPWLAGLVALVTSGVYVLLTYTTLVVAMGEFARGSFVISLSTAIPIWPGYFILPVAFALAAFISLYRVFEIAFPLSNTEVLS